MSMERKKETAMQPRVRIGGGMITMKLLERLNEPCDISESGGSYLDLVTEHILRKAAQGDINFIRLLLERTEGRAVPVITTVQALAVLQSAPPEELALLLGVSPKRLEQAEGEVQVESE